MRSADAIRAVLVLALSGGAAGCFPRPMSDSLPEPEATHHLASGAWARAVVEDSAGGTTRDHSGELIAVHADTIFILDPYRLRALDRHAVSSLRVERYAPDSAAGLWVMAGVASTLSHGLILVLSAPLWTLFGSITAAEYASSYVLVDSDYDRARSFARFPQGLPPEIDRSKITAAPSGDEKDR